MNIIFFILLSLLLFFFIKIRLDLKSTIQDINQENSEYAKEIMNLKEENKNMTISQLELLNLLKIQEGRINNKIGDEDRREQLKRREYIRIFIMNSHINSLLAKMNPIISHPIPTDPRPRFYIWGIKENGIDCWSYFPGSHSPIKIKSLYESSITHKDRSGSRYQTTTTKYLTGILGKPPIIYDFLQMLNNPLYVPFQLPNSSINATKCVFGLDSNGQSIPICFDVNYVTKFTYPDYTPIRIGGELGKIVTIPFNHTKAIITTSLGYIVALIDDYQANIYDSSGNILGTIIPPATSDAIEILRITEISKEFLLLIPSNIACAKCKKFIFLIDIRYLDNILYYKINIPNINISLVENGDFFISESHSISLEDGTFSLSGEWGMVAFFYDYEEDKDYYVYTELSGTFIEIYKLNTTNQTPEIENVYSHNEIYAEGVLPEDVDMANSIHLSSPTSGVLLYFGRRDEHKLCILYYMQEEGSNSHCLTENIYYNDVFAIYY